MTGVSPMPRQFAPLLRNAWYVAAARQDVSREFKAITLLDEPLVLFRSEAGEPIVYDDRCPHRMFPLSRSHLIGDSIRCGYHGFTFDGSGRCVFVPGSPHKPNFGLRRYPAIERGPWLWVWMGDDDAADPAQIPLRDFAYEDESYFDGYMLNECNYMLVIENLLDLTHIHYLHGPQLADKAYADTPAQKLDVENGVGTTKSVTGTELNVLGAWCGDDPTRLVKLTEENRIVGPSLFDYHQINEAIDRFDEPINAHSVRIYHALSPANLYQTHQFFCFAFSAPLQISKDEARAGIVDNFFAQDLEAVSYQMKAILNDKRDASVERRMLGDRAAMQMHRMLNRRAEQEAEAERRHKRSGAAAESQETVG